MPMKLFFKELGYRLARKPYLLQDYYWVSGAAPAASITYQGYKQAELWMVLAMNPERGGETGFMKRTLTTPDGHTLQGENQIFGYLLENSGRLKGLRDHSYPPFGLNNLTSR